MSTTLSPQILQELAEACDIRENEIEDAYGCTFFQSSTMVESAARPAANVLRVILRIEDSIDKDCFAEALERVVAANNILRARFVDSSEGILQVITTRHFHLSRPSADIGEYLHNDKLVRMGWNTCLFRGALIGRSIVLTMHHSIMDYATTPSLIRDALRVYRGEAVPMRSSFRAFVEACDAINEEEAKAFWSLRFRGAPSVFPRVEAGHLPDASEIVTRKVTLSKSELSMVHVPSMIEAAWALTCRVYTGSNSIAFGMILSGRKVSSSSGHLDDVVGPTIVAVPVQVDVRPGMKVGTMLRERTAARRELQTTRFLQWSRTKIRAINSAAQSASAFQTLINIRPSVAELPSGVVHEKTVDPLAAFGLSLNCDLAEEGLTIEAAADPAVIPSRQLHRIVSQLEHFLLALAEADSDTEVTQLKSLSDRDRTEIGLWNKSVPTALEACLHDLFRVQAQRSPQAGAIEATDGRATYSELEQWSSIIANRLRQSGTLPGDSVVFIFGKSLWAIVSILGILKAGAVCVPVEMSDPPDRKKQIVRASKATVALVASNYMIDAEGDKLQSISISAESIAEMSETWEIPEHELITPTDPAFIIFTSGSTGEPKGVILEHRSLATSLQHLASRLEWNSHCRTLQFAAHVWDISLGEIFGTLLFGGCLCIPSEESRKSNLLNFMAESRISRAWLTPTVINTLFPSDVPTLERLLTVGEPIAPEAAALWGGSLRLLNGWGPCEASILSTIAELTPSSQFPESIGTAVNCITWIVNVDDYSQLSPIGAIGELVIEGETVARGYLEDKAKTIASFLDPQPWLPVDRQGKGTKLYRTGDLARYYSDGSICFLGRRDNQVKIRGQRFELGEVEGIVKGCPEVRDIVCRTKVNRGRTELVAILSLSDERFPQNRALQAVPESYQQCSTTYLRTVRDYVRSRLPSFMVPTAWLVVQALPRTPSAKLDRAAIGDWLKDQSLEPAKAALQEQLAEVQPPVTHIESRLQSIWSSVLRVPTDDIGRESRFLLLGGDSILAMQAASRCTRDGLNVAASAILANMPLCEIANAVSTAAERLPAGKNIIDETAYLLNGSATEMHATSSAKWDGVPATDAQALMLAVGENRGNLNDFILDFTPAIDANKLRLACQQVVEHHPILRTDFVVRDATLQQVPREEVPIESISENLDDSRLRNRIDLGDMCPRFYLSVRENRCHRLRLNIHHAYYDAISLGLVFRDLSAAYTDNPLSHGPSFGAWVKFQSTADKEAAKTYWTQKLQQSSMSYIVSAHPQQVPCCSLDGRLSVRVPLNDLKSSLATPSTMLRAAWAIFLQYALNTNDIVFGQVNANRYLPMPEIEQVKGPCLNILPVRAQAEESTSLATLITRMQEDFVADMPHHHLGFRDIIKQCTRWPSWTRYSSILIFQNHTALDTVVEFGSVRASLSGQDRLAGSADMWIIATPFLDALELDIRFSLASISTEEACWISDCLTHILKAMTKGLSTTLGSVKATLSDAYPTYKLPLGAPVIAPPVSYDQSHSPSPFSVDLVWKAWRELGLSVTGDEKEDGRSMFDRGADLVTVLLLTQRYNVTMESLLAHPSRALQAHLLDSVSDASRTTCTSL